MRERRSINTPTRVATVLVVVLALLSFGQAAFAAFTPPPGVTVTPGGEDCNGIIPTPGSENTVKTLTGLTTDAQGTHAQYTIAYPVDPSDVGDTFQIVDCVLSGSGSDLKKYDVLDEATFDGVVNSTSFNLTFQVTIPIDTPIGTRICNVAKTTEGPSAPSASNRKAGPACFIVGGDARVEKHSTTDPTGDPIGGATFKVWDCNNTADDELLQPILVTPTPSSGDIYSDTLAGGAVVEATAGTVGFSGPSGSTCKITETVPPAGYSLPATVTQTVTIPVGSGGATVYTFLDPPSPGSVHIHKDAPGSQQSTVFNFDITCTNPSHTYTTSITGSGDSTVNDIPAGSICQVTETNAPSVDNVVIDPSGTFTVASSQTVDVTVTNSLKPGSLTVTKVAPEGSTDVYSFTVTCTNDPNSPYAFDITGSDSHTISGIPAGSSCTVAETDPGSKYNSPFYSPSTTVTIDPDATVTVTVTNSLAPGSLTINKVAPAAGQNDTFTFSVDCGDENVYELQIVGSDSATQSGIPAGSVCTITESTPSGYANPTYDPSNVVTIGAGDGVSVTATNTLLPLSISIDKTVNPASGAPGDSVTYTYVVTNTGQVDLIDVKVTDDKLGDIGTIPSLKVGESATLTKATTLPNAAGELTNVGTATGHDRLGREATDSDTAVVTVVLAKVIVQGRVLPKTGSDLRIPLESGFALLGIGFVLIAIARKRRLASEEIERDQI